MNNLLEVMLQIGFKELAPFGSRVVGCATEHSDYDYLVLVSHRPDGRQMEGTGFIPDAEDPMYGPDFSSWKNGKTNVIFTDSKDYFDATMEACAFCKEYEVYDKVDRCKVHDAYRALSKIKE